ARNEVHIIDLLKTQAMLEEACKAAKQIARSGRKILFVGTKKQAKEVVMHHALSVNMPYVVERWLGGMLTNFATVRKSVKKLQSIEKMETDGTFDLLQKKERLMLGREKAKLERVLNGIVDMTKLPGALLIVDIGKEHIAVAEARRLNIPTIGIVDTNSNPNLVDFPIPGNDDAVKSIDVLLGAVASAIKEAQTDRKSDREIEAAKAESEGVAQPPAAEE
ncbi:MAG: 30S ribosomal protein S2, partial [Bacteroidia bacterium]|nr:30S ribosomal protein S2 [Bacteroidia bacterium]